MNSYLEKEKYSLKDYLGALVPSIIGILILMIPFKYEGETTIFVALLADKLTKILGDILPFIIMIIISITGIMTFIYKVYLSKKSNSLINRSNFLKNIFDVSWIWVIIRIFGMFFSISTYFKIGPAIIWENNTGGLILFDLLLTLFSVFLFAGIMLPFLTDFGLLEFIGVLLTPAMRPLFKLPGRSAINCVVSWVGDGTIGVAFTNSQYEEGYYTAKEAAIIVTNFSAVSITFCLVVLSQVGLSNMFGIYYLTTIIAGVVAAIIMPRIPPLSRKPDEYIGGEKKDTVDDIPKGYTRLEWGRKLAIEKSRENLDLRNFLLKGIETVLDMWLGVLPVIMALGTLGLIIAEYTYFFEVLGKPFIPLLELMKVPYAKEASQTIMVGFADMFLPSVIGSTIPSEMTRFIIATLSVTQLIYISEAGAVMLGSKIPINLLDLFIIFIERTLITLPIIVGIAHIIF